MQRGRPTFIACSRSAGCAVCFCSRSSRFRSSRSCCSRAASCASCSCVRRVNRGCVSIRESSGHCRRSHLSFQLLSLPDWIQSGWNTLSTARLSRARCSVGVAFAYPFREKLFGVLAGLQPAHRPAASRALGTAPPPPSCMKLSIRRALAFVRLRERTPTRRARLHMQRNHLHWTLTYSRLSHPLQHSPPALATPVWGWRQAEISH